jgi:hypothetical protein
VIRIAVVTLVSLWSLACKKDPDRDPTPSAPPAPPSAHRETAPPSPPLPTADAYVELDPSVPIGPPMAAHAKAALAAGKTPYAYLHADWCKPCVAIAESRTTDPLMKDAFAGTFLIGVDIDHVPQQQLIDQSLPFTAIPVFYRLDATGVPDGKSIDGGAWDADTPANMAAALKPFFTP